MRARAVDHAVQITITRLPARRASGQLFNSVFEFTFNADLADHCFQINNSLVRPGENRISPFYSRGYSYIVCLNQ